MTLLLLYQVVSRNGYATGLWVMAADLRLAHADKIILPVAMTIITDAKEKTYVRVSKLNIAARSGFPAPAMLCSTCHTVKLREAA